MKNFAVIGNPIEHSLSPIMHNWIFKKLMIQAQYNKILLEYNDSLVMENMVCYNQKMLL